MKKNSAYLIKEALAEIKEITVDEAKKMSNDILFLDIREKEELLNIPSIENSIFIPRGLLEFYADEENSLYEKKLNTKFIWISHNQFLSLIQQRMVDIEARLLFTCFNFDKTL